MLYRKSQQRDCLYRCKMLIILLSLSSNQLNQVGFLCFIFLFADLAHNCLCYIYCILAILYIAYLYIIILSSVSCPVTVILLSHCGASVTITNSLYV